METRKTIGPPNVVKTRLPYNPSGDFFLVDLSTKSLLSNICVGSGSLGLNLNPTLRHYKSYSDYHFARRFISCNSLPPNNTKDAISIVAPYVESA